MVTFDLVAVLALCLLLLGVQRASAARTYRGTRVISCPATGQAAAVELAVWRGAFHSLQVRECSRWPAECLRKDLLTEVLGAGRDAKIAGLPLDAAQVLRLMCTDLVKPV